MKRNIPEKLYLITRSFALIFSAGLLVACTTTPNPGRSGGRMSWSEDSQSDSGVSTADLAEASDIIARSLIADLDRLVMEKFPPNEKVVLLVGNIENMSNGVIQTGDLQIVRDRITNSLRKSDAWRDNVEIRRSANRIRDINRRERGDGDLLGKGGNAAEVELADLSHTYYLNGDAFGSTKGSTVLRLTFTLDSARTSEIIFSESYEQKYQ